MKLATLLKARPLASYKVLSHYVRYEKVKTGQVEPGPKTVTVQWYRQILEAKALLDSVTLDGRII
jgi:hypothetical protein